MPTGLAQLLESAVSAPVNDKSQQHADNPWDFRVVKHICTEIITKREAGENGGAREPTADQRTFSEHSLNL